MLKDAVKHQKDFIIIIQKKKEREEKLFMKNINIFIKTKEMKGKKKDIKITKKLWMLNTL